MIKWGVENRTIITTWFWRTGKTHLICSRLKKAVMKPTDAMLEAKISSCCQIKKTHISHWNKYETLVYECFVLTGIRINSNLIQWCLQEQLHMLSKSSKNNGEAEIWIHRQHIVARRQRVFRYSCLRCWEGSGKCIYCAFAVRNQYGELFSKLFCGAGFFPHKDAAFQVFKEGCSKTFA